MTTPDAAAERAARLSALGARTFDVLVVGGGITGCGIAYDAALRGLDVALVERNDFASGTSSRSSRLIHGGVRYLEHGHLRLVFESSRERRRLLRLAPHLVHPLEFTWPVYDGARVPRWKLGAGLLLYDALSLFRNVGWHHRLSRHRILAREPALRVNGLRGGATYFDARTDDARLTLANALSAASAGAVIINHATVRELIKVGTRIAGAIVLDQLTGAVLEVRARTVVNATGPWSDELRHLDGDVRSAVRGSRGAHIAVPRDRIGNVGAVTLLSPSDGRVCFVLPSGSQTIIGTTDKFTATSPDDVRATAADIDYLLNAANAFFPDARLVSDDVVSAWAGIRPLIPTDDQSPGAASREHLVATSASGLVSITGGKLTTYRVMASDVMNVVRRRLGRPRAEPATHRRPLHGGDIISFEGEIAVARRSVRDDELARHLVATHGSKWRDVWETIASTADGSERLDRESRVTLGELRYAVSHEMACTLGDLLIRRTRLAFERRDQGMGVAFSAAAAVASNIGWSSEQIPGEVATYRDEIAQLFATDKKTC